MNACQILLENKDNHDLRVVAGVEAELNPTITGALAMNANGGGDMGGPMMKVAGAMVAAAMIALSGCYIFSPSQAAVDKQETAMHFDVSQCQQTGPNLYKCPGVDKSICGAFYAGQQVDCLKLDKDGNVTVMKQ